MRYPLTDSIRLVPGVGPIVHDELLRMGIRTLGDLVRWFPRRYLDGTNPVPVRHVPYGELAAVKVTIGTIGQKFTKSRGIKLTEAVAHDANGDELIIRWFNQPYIANKVHAESEWVCIGVVKSFNRQRVMTSPRLESEPKIIPMYSQSKTVTSAMITGFMRWVLSNAELGEGVVPQSLAESRAIGTFEHSLKAVHQPETLGDTLRGKAYFAFEEVFDFFMGLQQTKNQTKIEKGIAISPDMEWFKEVVSELPFTLTNGQRQVVWEALQDLADGTLMTRLLNGDVGSGKTVVAALLAAAVAKQGYRTLVLVPTEILASQHRETLAKLLEKPGFSVAAWTGSRKENLEADVIVGTHALLQEKVSVEKVGLVVIDEQHRFGVRQRTLLREKHAQPPHFLSMTATPIPRTLALALFADLSVSFLKEKPANRLPVITQIIRQTDMTVVHKRVVTELAAGHQVLVLCPLIHATDDTEGELNLFGEPSGAEKKTVLAEVERLQKDHPEYGVIEAVHGKMKSVEKRAVMERMAAGEINVLVATSVIEVGVDLPNATVMIIQGAEHFGLAQLHQFRGRVGRGASQSYCFLCPGLWSPAINERLKALVESDSGFDIAEKDLALRGPGDLAGLVQSGLPDFRLVTLANTEFLVDVRDAVERFCSEHPHFAAAYPGIRSINVVGGLE